MGTRHWPEDADEAVEKLESEIKELKFKLNGYLKEASRCAIHANTSILNNAYPQANGAILLSIHHINEALALTE